MATQVIKDYPNVENIHKEEIQACYSVLSNIYIDGIYVPKDINKSISILKESNLGILYSKIANIYLERIENFSEAEKWYKKAYKYQNNPEYLSIVKKYQTTLPNNETNISEDTPKIVPIIDNITGIKQLSVGLESQHYYFIATLQKSIRVYDKKTFKLLKILRGFNGIGLDGVVTAMAFDEKKNYLYYTPLNSTTNYNKNHMINVFDIKNGEIVKSLPNTNMIKTTTLSLSDDGAYILAVNSDNFNIINIDNNNTQSYTKPIPNINIITGKIVKKGEEQVAYILDDHNTLWGYSIDKKRQITKEPYKDQIKFPTFEGTEPRIQKIIKRLIPEKKYLNLKDILLNINKILNIEKNTSPIVKNSIYAANYKNANTSIEIFNKTTKKIVTTIDLLSIKILRYIIIEDKFVVLILNDASQMLVYDLKGNAIAVLKGYKTLQNSLLYYHDKYLFSAGEDNIINIWDMQDLNDINSSENNYDTSMLNYISKDSGGNPLKMLSETLDKDFLEQFAKTQKLSYIPTEKQLKSYLRLILLKKEILYPALSLYVQDEDRWILYNKDGFFTSSEKGKNLIKYHINQGLTKEAKIIENEQIFEKFYRPDLIKKILSGEEVDEKIDIRSILLNIQPPKVTIVGNSFKDEKNIEIKYKICDTGSGISNTSIILNGISGSLKNSRGFTIENTKKVKDECTLYSNIITLEPGENNISIRAFDSKKIISSTSAPLTLNANYKIDKKADLYFLSLAVSDYKNDDYNLKYAVTDAHAVEKKIKKNSKKLFEKIYTYNLYDNNMTKENFNEVIKKISKQINTYDVFVIYMAGHGITKDGLYYFLPYDIPDIKTKNLQKYAISDNDISDTLAQIVARKSLLLLDTCASGSVIDNADNDINTKMAIDRLAQKSNRNYIAASSAKEVALEGYNNHGVFTYVVLDAFNKASKIDLDLSVKLLGTIVESGVPKITKKSHYIQTPKVHIGNDFILGTP
jgi:hypothetical protein